MNTALILIDIQNDYFPGGKNELVNTEQTIAHTKRVLSLFRDNELPIFYVQHISPQENATFFLPNTDGIKIHKQIFPQPHEKVIVKHTPDSFFQTELQHYLKLEGIKQLVICGMMSHMCIDTTVRTAKQLGYDITLLNEACTTKDLEWNDSIIPAETVHNTFMSSLQGIFAKVLDTNAFVNDMQNILF